MNSMGVIVDLASGSRPALVPHKVVLCAVLVLRFKTNYNELLLES